ncbi:MAG: family 78 glycoside hydrolase catalytic domain [Terricaulis sp.]
MNGAATADKDCDHTVAAVELRARAWSDSLCLGERMPALSWRLATTSAPARQLAYELQIASDVLFTCDVASSGEVASKSPIAAAWPASALESREVRWARVRARTDGGWTTWSTPLRVEAGLLERQDWRARPISPRANAHQSVPPRSAALLRRLFTLTKPIESARLYVSALGAHETWINGVRVGKALLAPGWTAYKSRLLYDAYDVAGLLRAGENVIASRIGDAWWRGNLTWMSRRAVYGDTTALLAQLEIRHAGGDTMVVATDQSWKGGEGEIVAADLYDGCQIDLRRAQRGWRDCGFDDAAWEDVVALPLPDGLELRSAPPVRVVQRIPLSAARLSPTRLALDTGQNFSGYLHISARGVRGARLSVRHAEVRDADGAIFTAPLRNAKATDSYVFGWDGGAELAPSFTFHGFRYAEIDHDPGVVIDAIEACVIASDLRDIGAFSCSDARVNQLFDNVRWSQRGNFLSLPTDCPQRDERLGWTGDIQVFAAAACANADAQTFLASWLKDLAIEQRSDGCVPSTVPNVIGGHDFEYAGATWGDAATLTPWRLYLAYGDAGVLKTQFESMQAWVDYCASRLSGDGVWANDFQLGDWLDPGAPSDRPELGRTDRDFIASAYLSFSASTLAKTAVVLGDAELAKRYAALSAAVAAATWRRWREHALTTQTGCALAIMFEIAPSAEHAPIGAALAKLVQDGDGCIGTGFVGTPLVLPALCRGGRAGAAYKLLLNEKCPGWLYQIKQGATTIWERWDAIGEDGKIHSGDMASGAAMTSFNHYAYGAVAAWLYESVAGIAADEAGPGYQVVRFAPEPGDILKWASASLETPLGRSAIAWSRQDDGALVLQLEVAPGARGVVVAPQGWLAPAQTQLESGRHTFILAPS